MVKRQKQQQQTSVQVYGIFFVVQSGLNVYLNYSGRRSEVFSGPTVEACSGAYIVPQLRTFFVEDRVHLVGVVAKYPDMV